MPHNGVFWTRESMFVSGKIISGEDCKNYIDRTGSITGWFYDGNERRLANKVCDLVEGFADSWHLTSRNKSEMGHLLLRRGQFSLPRDFHGGNGELESLKRPALLPYYNMTVSHMKMNKPISQDDRFEAMERTIELATIDEIGVYLRIDLTRDNVFYLGKAQEQSIGKRSTGHYNGTLFLVRAWIVNTPRNANDLECLIHDILSVKGVESFRHGRHTKGLYRIPTSLHTTPIKLLDEIFLLPSVRSLFRSSVSFGQIAKVHAPTVEQPVVEPQSALLPF